MRPTGADRSLEARTAPTRGELGRGGGRGEGIGASHQTGWTGLVATLIDLFGHLDARRYLEAKFNPKFAPRD